MIATNLKIRSDYRRKENIRMKSTSVDRYHDYTDRKYEEELVKQ